MTDSPIVELRQVSKRFGDVPVIEALDLAVSKGEFLTLLGPSGCGKTTTLRMIGGFETPTRGAVYLGGKEVTYLPPYQRDVNTVFQSYALFPHMTVRQNVAYGLERKRVPRAEIARRVDEVLAMVQMESLASRKPRELSGGQQQRVAVARAIVNRPSVLLLDEPLGALDLKLRKEMQVELKGLQRQLGMTFVYVTHDQEEALTMSDRIAVMNAGRIEQLATPVEIYGRPRTRFVADFIGETNLLSGVAETRGDHAWLVVQGERIPIVRGPGEAAGHADPSASQAQELHLSIRPELVTVSADRPGEAVSLHGTVEQTIFVGAVWKTIVRLGGGAVITASEPPSSHGYLEPGTRVHVSWDPGAAVLLIE